MLPHVCPSTVVKRLENLHQNCQFQKKIPYCDNKRNSIETDNGRLLKLCALNVCHDIHLCLYFQHCRINSFRFLTSLRSKKHAM
jgi:hypothetical protein